MKICYLADANSVHTKKWCNYFADRGNDIYVISLNGGKIDNPNVKIYSLGMNIESIRYGGIFSKFKYLFKIFSIKKIIKTIKPDIVHAHYASSYGLLGALLNFHPYVISVWGSDVYDFPQKGFMFKQIIKYSLSKADKVLSTSNAMKIETSLYTNKKIYVTPFGVDINKFKPNGEKIIKDNNEFVIDTVKALEKKYGIEYLINAFSMIKKYFPQKNLKLEIAGIGSELDNLKKQVQDLNIEKCVNFLGFLNQDEVNKAFNRFNVAVFPSIMNSESFGVAAVEAQACGVPVIVSDVGGLPEATSPNNSSLIVRKENAEDIFYALKLLIENDNLRMNMSKNARNFAEEKYNIKDNFSFVEKLYEDMLSL